MAIKKSDLYSSLWQSCDELRGGMDASQYKDYILVLLFVKYVSDKHSQKDSVFTVPKGASFTDMVNLKGQKEIGDKINIIIGSIAKANDLDGIVNVADFNDEAKLGKGKDMVDRLTALIGIFESLDFKANRADGDDLLGDAYEYLMRHFASQSGKSKGQFYTPAEVSRIMAKVINVNKATRADQTIYDPTCGSGSLLLKAQAEALATKNIELTIYGQEMDVATRAMAKMNMILHNCPSAEIVQGNTITNPHFLSGERQLKTFDFIVANPPFSTKSWTSGINPNNDLYNRFDYGIPPAKNGDYAFLLHILASLKTTGAGAIVLPHGVLFRGNAEAVIRKNLIERGYIKGIIGLPANLFYGTSIPACIIVLDKGTAKGRDSIFMIDASTGFIKDGDKNRLREQDIHKIVDTFNSQTSIPKYSKLVSIEGIKANEYNLNIPRYIDSTKEEDRHDIYAHLHGGIPKSDIDELSNFWEVLPNLRQKLVKNKSNSNYCELILPLNEIKSAINQDSDFIEYKQSIMIIFVNWKERNKPLLLGLTANSNLREVIENLSESLLNCFKNLRLLDAYDIYQHLMTYWNDTMQDDVYMLITEGYDKSIKPVLLLANKNTKNSDAADLIIDKSKYKTNLLPPNIVIDNFFKQEKINLDNLSLKIASIQAEIESLEQEQEGDDGLLEEVKDDKGSINKTAITKRIKEIKKDETFKDEMILLKKYQKCLDDLSKAEKDFKKAENNLNKLVLNKYSELSEAEIKQLIIEDKWFSYLNSTVVSEVDKIPQALVNRLKELANRYETPLPKIEDEVKLLSAKVEKHLQKMGFSL